MNSLLYYYNNVQKMAAYRQAKRMQRGALTAQGGFSATDPALLQVPYTIQCVFVPTIVSSVLQVVFNTKGFSKTPRIDITASGLVQSYGGGEIMYSSPAILNAFYDLVYVLTDSNTILYVNGDKVKESPACDPMTLYNVGYYLDNNKLYFQGDYILHRHFKGAMSADDVKALDNNGDPMGYVVPKAKRDGLLAEYLPQNLMYGRDDKTIATSWLDSAKQLPDEYMEPLFQSIGGYDMAANGAPEILYNE